MSKKIVGGALLCVAFSGFVTHALGQSKSDPSAVGKTGESAKDQNQNVAPSSKPAIAGVYRPPSRGAPQTRLGGGTRGDTRGLNVAVIAPDHTGLSSTNQPDLYWFVSRPVAAPVEFVLMEVDGIEPLLEKQLPAPETAGIHRISLANLGAKLQLGKEYQWSVSLVKDANARSKDTMAAGKIKVQPFIEASQKALETATPESAHLLYAEAGYWYDAISRLRSRLAMSPMDQQLINSQAALLEQVGLRDVARFEKESIK